LAANTIQHGTRQGYKAGCRDNGTTPACPAPQGITCNQASNKYQKEQRDLRKLTQTRRPPVHARTSPKTGGIRVSVINPRSEASDNQGYPSPDMPIHDAPESLSNARVNPDPDPGESPSDYEYIPDFVITPGIKNDIAGKLGLFAAIIGMPLEAMDDFCGPIFVNNADNIIDKLLPIICRSPGAVKFFQAGNGGWLDWLALLQATWPVIKAGYMHHLAKTVGKDTRVPPNATMPPMPADDYQYSAA
jgi:hypothetical protein